MQGQGTETTINNNGNQLRMKYEPTTGRRRLTVEDQFTTELRAETDTIISQSPAKGVTAPYSM